MYVYSPGPLFLSVPCLCLSLLPVSVLNMGRRIFVFACSFIYAVMINDILNNGAAQTQYYTKPAITLLAVPFLEMIGVLFTRWRDAKKLASELDTTQFLDYSVDDFYGRESIVGGGISAILSPFSADTSLSLAYLDSDGFDGDLFQDDDNEGPEFDSPASLDARRLENSYHDL